MSYPLMGFTNFEIGNEEYLNDYYDAMIDQEKNCRPLLKQSPQLHLRSELIEWIKEVCRITNLNILVLHLSVAILDTFMDNYDILPFRQRPIAATSLILAAKFEQCNSLPTYARVFSIDPKDQEVPPMSEIFLIERQVLNEFNWRLICPTVATFISYLLPFAMHSSDLSPTAKPSLEKELRMEMRDYLQDAAHKILLNHEAMNIPRSLLGAASVMAARLHLELEPAWPQRLIDLTHYQATDLTPILPLVIDYERMSVDDAANTSSDSGYMSSSGSFCLT